jgi:hypothetical protein
LHDRAVDLDEIERKAVRRRCAKSGTLGMIFDISQSSRPADPRPTASAGASSRFIPNDLNKAKPLANASRRHGSL